MKLDFSVVLDAWPAILSGVFGTMYLALSGMALALVIGVLGVAILRSHKPIPSLLVNAFIEVIRNTPFLVQIFFVSSPCRSPASGSSPTATAIVALGLNGGAYAIEIIRGGVREHPEGPDRGGAGAGPAQARRCSGSSCCGRRCGRSIPR